MKSLIYGALALILSTGCAVLHHVQVGEIDNRKQFAAVPFEILMSETGLSVEEAGKIARALESGGNHGASSVAGIIALFQQGPRTGNPVYNERYAEKLIYVIHEKCPSGHVTGLMSIREMRKYPVVSGEIVKLTGYCLRPRTAADGKENLPKKQQTNFRGDT